MKLLRLNVAKLDYNYTQWSRAMYVHTYLQFYMCVIVIFTACTVFMYSCW